MSATTALKKAVPFVPRVAFPDYRVVQTNFRGHHVQTLKKLQQLMPQIDLVLELRDARAPISTKNILLDRLFEKKNKIILY